MRDDPAAGHEPEPRPQAEAVGPELKPGVLMQARSLVSVLARAVADTVVPPVCLACHARLAVHDALCAPCWGGIDFIGAPLCDRLGIPLPFDTAPFNEGGTMISAAAVASPPDYDRARAVAGFGDTMQKLIHGFKYSDRHDARRLFGRWLTAAGRDVLADADVLVPVPLNRWRLLHRRFNQSALLANEVSRLTGVPVDAMSLVRVKATTAQVGLTASERLLNVAGAFKVSSAGTAAITGKRVVLVDDVITTGATVNAATRALRKAGAARIDVLALALVTT